MDCPWIKVGYRLDKEDVRQRAGSGRIILITRGLDKGRG
jgi:hypothetical protein